MMINSIETKPKKDPKITKSDTRFYLLLLIIFATLAAIAIIHHEMWRDELEAWLIASNSSSVVSLLENIEYTGHPGLWYLCLYIINKFWQHPWAMQLFHLLIAITFVYIFLWYSPFSKLQKALFCFGYFPLYEYSVISRSYSLSFVFLFTFCALFPSRYRRYLPLAVILALLAHLNAYGLIISFALVLTLVLDAIVNFDLNKKLYSRRWSIVASLAIYSFGLITAIIQITPPENAKNKGDLLSVAAENLNGSLLKSLVSIPFSIRRIVAATYSVWRGYIPVPDFSEFHFHNTNILSIFVEGSSNIYIDGAGLIDLLEFSLSLVILAMGIILFYRQPIILFFYLISNLAIIGFTYLFQIAYARHSGFLFIIFLICLWLSTYYRQSNWLASFNHQIVTWLVEFKLKILTILLCIHALGGIYAYSRDLIHPFSASQAATKYIQQNQYDRLTIVGSEDVLVAPIGALLDKEIYYPETKEFGTFTVWTKDKFRRDNDITQSDILAQTNDLIEEDEGEILLILTEKLVSKNYRLKIKTLAKFETSIIENEVYYLYLVTQE
ncbi:MAG: hypothetical protein QNJ72_21475 [Pleurocapsa sp. MO_226.B13]|nr:hypothetical protein [Pleurocapsa sp. MO_226.B13]